MRKSNDSSIGRSCSDIRTCFRSLSIVLSERDVEVVGHDASSLRQRIGDYFAALFDDVLFVYFFFKTSSEDIILISFIFDIIETEFDKCIM